jgi:hypothetical protein
VEPSHLGLSPQISMQMLPLFLDLFNELTNSILLVVGSVPIDVPVVISSFSRITDFENLKHKINITFSSAF